MSSSWPSHTALGLNESQYAAFKTALTNEISIIQGPPGTGKSYLGAKIVKLLLRNRNAWGGSTDPGPILVICYTNHALDQFLEDIIDRVYTSKRNFLVRVGSRSESEILKQWNLRAIQKESKPSAGFCRARSEVHRLANALQELQFKLRETLSGILKRDILCPELVHDDASSDDTLQWLGLFDEHFVNDLGDLKNQYDVPVEEQEQQESVENTIENNSRRLDVDEYFDDTTEEVKFGSKQAYNFNGQFPHEDKEMAHRATSAARYLLRTMRNPQNLPDQVKHFYNCYIRNWSRYMLRLSSYQDELQHEAEEVEAIFRHALDVFKEERDARDKKTMQDSHIIGMTTTAAATYQKVLDDVGPKIIVVEEAAEIMEAHVVTSISKHCQQLVMIGDHKQLQPKANMHTLEKPPYNLRVSLFEKLLLKGVSVDRLTVQHRMRPEIRQLLVPDIYEDLKDHVSVMSMENVKGMKHSLYFIDHETPEDHKENASSYSNTHEAEYLLNLADYLLKQGYSPQNITILTPYRGQTRNIRNLIKYDDVKKDMKVTAIDNYQGEENDIVLLSLVRSNKDKRVGFMKEATRICVSLSRARKGLYVIGNFKQFVSSSKIWTNINANMKRKGQLGSSLWLQCDNHDKPIHTEIKVTGDFKSVVAGGCSLPCGIRLECGHVCPSNCHSIDKDHIHVICVKPCARSCPNGHRCRKRCFEKCQCTELMEKTIPSCGHQQQVECGMSPEDFTCKERCQKKLECGHTCREYCGKVCPVRCLLFVEVTLQCGHLLKTECYKSAHPEKILCRVPCSAILKCEHPCKGTCGQCFQGRLHVPCKERCNRDLVCGHHCTANCASCPPCEKACRRKCKHAHCQRPCWQECVPCKEPCDWRCKHYKCNNFCGDPCDRPRCNSPCQRKLKCEHLCVGLCGEPCPKLCRICNKDELCEIFFGNEDEENARFIVLECGHTFEVEGLDEWMDQVPDPNNAIQPKLCPRCKQPVHSILRYGNLIKQNYADVDFVKSKIAGQAKASQKQSQSVLDSLRNLGVSWSFTTKDWKERERRDLAQKGEVLLSLLETLNSITNRTTMFAAPHELVILANKYEDRLDRMASSQVNEHEVEEFHAELERFRLFEHFQTMMTNDSIKQLLTEQEEDKTKDEPETELKPFDVRVETDKISHIFQTGRVLTTEDTDYIRSILKKSTEISKLPGVSDEERKMIVKAMNFKPGHWYKCPEGHVYAIGECGGAMERSKCPECGSKIGGLQHSLTEGNAVASEMDGARHAAWSDAANMENYNLDDFE